MQSNISYKTVNNHLYYKYKQILNANNGCHDNNFCLYLSITKHCPFCNEYKKNQFCISYTAAVCHYKLVIGQIHPDGYLL